MLQGFRLAPTAFPYCLSDTHLKALHLCLYVSPVSLVPHVSGARGRTSVRYLRIDRRHLLFLVQRLLKILSPLMTSRKSARFRVRQCFSPYLDRYSRAFAFSAFLYPLRLLRSLRSACRRRQRDGLTLD